MRLLSTFAIGLIFGLGIVISGMSNPAKVINFFDLAGSWDPSLAFVMGGALIITFVGYRMVFRRAAPLIDQKFALPTKTALDMSLLGGAAVFGVGWGIAGFCPGGALPVAALLLPDVSIFIGAMLVGIVVATALKNRYARLNT